MAAPTPRPFTVTRAVGPLAAWAWDGPPPAALLLHGIGNYARYWDRFTEAVGGRLRLVAPDARGHGSSAKPERGYERAEFVADALAVLADRGIARAVVVGHSMGGRHAIALAAAQPERVRALVVVDTGPETLPEGAARARRLTGTRPASFSDEATALAWLRETSPGYDDGVYADRLVWLFERERPPLRFRSSQDALMAILATRATDPEADWRELAAIRCPTVIVRGTRSNVLGADAAHRMVATMRDARLVELDAGHNVPLERAREVADIVVELARSV